MKLLVISSSEMLNVSVSGVMMADVLPYSYFKRESIAFSDAMDRLLEYSGDGRMCIELLKEYLLRVDDEVLGYIMDKFDDELKNGIALAYNFGNVGDIMEKMDNEAFFRKYNRSGKLERCYKNEHIESMLDYIRFRFRKVTPHQTIQVFIRLLKTNMELPKNTEFIDLRTYLLSL